jgi:hypothetical protein
VEAGTGQGNQNDLQLHFGLGTHTDPVIVEVRWPDGEVTRTEPIELKQIKEIVQPL